MNEIDIYIYILISGIFYGICDFFRALGARYINSGLLIVLQLLFSTIISFIFYYFYDKSIFIKFNKLNLMQLVIILLISITQIGFIYFFTLGNKINSSLKPPINIGILSSIVALYFIIVIICNIIYNLIKKEKIQITKNEIIGCILIIVGIIFITRK